ncbi:hypothetical protein L596_028105 [Steinernema carpocapsae]|uniref:Uncharacterized protein n=1 Tax=Steinernema carpocapsae TaxID=34508 RepID=A0A4U5LXF7_STECR|nr:hypothetical protein L596_028105 [Steinernema carpocapsae]
MTSEDVQRLRKFGCIFDFPWNIGSRPGIQYSTRRDSRGVELPGRRPKVKRKKKRYVPGIFVNQKSYFSTPNIELRPLSASLNNFLVFTAVATCLDAQDRLSYFAILKAARIFTFSKIVRLFSAASITQQTLKLFCLPLISADVLCVPRGNLIYSSSDFTPFLMGSPKAVVLPLDSLLKTVCLRAGDRSSLDNTFPAPLWRGDHNLRPPFARAVTLPKVLDSHRVVYCKDGANLKTEECVFFFAAGDVRDHLFANAPNCEIPAAYILHTSAIMVSLHRTICRHNLIDGPR